jgi:hypothetical protein
MEPAALPWESMNEARSPLLPVSASSGLTQFADFSPESTRTLDRYRGVL